LPADVDEAYNPCFEVLGNIGAILNALSKLAIKRINVGEIVNYKQMITRELFNNQEYEEFPVNPQQLIEDLRNATDDNAVICVDTGALKYLMTRYWNVHANRTLFLSIGLASMGFAIPAAIAGSIVFPKKQIVAVIGDGGLQMSLSDLPTIVEKKIDMTIVVFDNSSFGIVAAKQNIAGKKIFGTNLHNPDFCKIAEASGLKAFDITNTGDVYPTLKEALNNGVPSLVHIPVQRTEVEIMRQSTLK
jgi:acetolactate synthase-1/2/3 large subunit